MHCQVPFRSWRIARPGCRCRRVHVQASASVDKSSGKGFNVVVTGSTKGVGLALVRKHLAEGDSVVVCSRNESSVKAVTSELASRYGNDRVVGVACNVCKANDVANLVSTAQSKFGTIDLWINNAGTNAYSFKPLIESSEADLIDIVDTNVLGVMVCCQAAIKAMKAQPNGGHIFNMDGAGADGNPTPRFAAYGASKRALQQLGKSLQAELKQMEVTNIGIHNLSPGMVTTELLMSGADNAQGKFFINCLAETAEEVAAFLVPRVRDVPSKPSLSGVPTGVYIKFLTPIKAYSNIFSRLLSGKNKDRWVRED